MLAIKFQDDVLSKKINILANAYVIITFVVLLTVFLTAFSWIAKENDNNGWTKSANKSISEYKQSATPNLPSTLRKP